MSSKGLTEKDRRIQILRKLSSSVCMSGSIRFALGQNSLILTPLYMSIRCNSSLPVLGACIIIGRLNILLESSVGESIVDWSGILIGPGGRIQFGDVNTSIELPKQNILVPFRKGLVKYMYKTYPVSSRPFLAKSRPNLREQAILRQ